MEDTSEQEDDDWLDDEQWYCEHATKWSGRPVILGPEVLNDGVDFKKVLVDHFHDRDKELL